MAIDIDLIGATADLREIAFARHVAAICAVTMWMAVLGIVDLVTAKAFTAVFNTSHNESHIAARSRASRHGECVRSTGYLGEIHKRTVLDRVVEATDRDISVGTWVNDGRFSFRNVDGESIGTTANNVLVTGARHVAFFVWIVICLRVQAKTAVALGRILCSSNVVAF